MKRFNNNNIGGTIGNFIIPKKPKIEDDKIKKTTITTQYSCNGKSESIQKTLSFDSTTTSSSLPRIIGSSSIWTGSLRFGEQIVESIDLYPPMRECSKPSGFSSYLEMQQLTKFNDFINYWPIQELIKENNNKSSSLLLKKRSIIVYSSSDQQQQRTPVRISYLYLINTFSPLFARICKEMIEKELVAFGILSDYSLLFLIPNCQLSLIQLGIPTRECCPLLHCLFISNICNKTKNKFEIYNFNTIQRNPSFDDKFNGNDSKIVTKLESYQKESLLPINGLSSINYQIQQPKQLDSIFTPNQRPPGGKPLTPYIPTPGGYPPRHFPSLNYRPSIVNQYFPLSQQKQLNLSYKQQIQQPSTSKTDNNNFISMLLMPPPPPPPPESTKVEEKSSSSSNNLKNNNISSLERRQKNKAMIANAFEQVRNVGKTSTIMSEEVLSSSPKIIEQLNIQQKESEEDNLIKDPRLSKRSQQPLIQSSFNISPSKEKKNEEEEEEENIKIIKEEKETKKEELINETSSTMEIVNEEEEEEENYSFSSLQQQQPYSPSQVIISSNELMEQDNNEKQLNIQKTLKEKEDLQKEEENKIIEEKQKLIKNISQIDEGGEMPMDISASSTDLSTQIITSNNNNNKNNNNDELSPVSSDSDEKEEEISETIFPQLINTSLSSGFGFDYLTWNTSPLKICSEHVPISQSKINNETNIIGLEHFLHSNGGESSNNNNDNKIQIEDKKEEKKEEEDDKDFRQFWSSSFEIEQKKNEKTKSPPNKTIISSSSLPTSSSSSFEINNNKQLLPSLLDLNLTTPPPPIIPFSFFGNNNGNNNIIPKKQSPPQIQPFFNFYSETPSFNNIQQQQQLLSKVVIGSLFQGRSRIPTDNNDKGKYKIQRLDSPILSSTSSLPSSSKLNNSLSSTEFLMKDPNLEIHVLREEKYLNEKIKGILIIDILIDTKILNAQLLRLLEKAKQSSFLIKWHYCLTKRLEEITENKEDFLLFLKKFETNGTIELINKYFYDDLINIKYNNNIINYINYILNEIIERRLNEDNNIIFYFLNTGKIN